MGYLNRYPGVDPHLNSFLQAEGGAWESFHAEYIVQLRVALDARLPAGYLALAEKSLQISEIIPPRTRPVVMIYRARAVPAAARDADLPLSAPTATFALPDLLDDEETLTGVMIYQAGSGSPLGRPVTRIELLSPANLPGGSHHARYLERRLETLQSGLNLIEIDFLHESRPLLRAFASYPDGDPAAFPYVILVSNPHPSFAEGVSELFGFGVVDPVPVIAVPLVASESLVFDFGAVYHQVYASLRLVGAVVDYAQEPTHFSRYQPDDQALIRLRMQQIAPDNPPAP